MKRAASLLWMLGLALVVGLVAYHGIAEILAAMAVAGWGLLIVSAYSLSILAADTLGWRQLIPKQSRPPILTLILTRWICGSINSLLPVIQVGGDFVRARLATLQGVPGAVASASVVVDITAAVITQIVFSVVGIFFLFQHDEVGNTTIFAIGGVLILGCLIGGFYYAQRAGLFLKLARVFEQLVQIDAWKMVVGGVEALDNAVNAIYRRRREFVTACGWRLLGWVIGVGEVWLALYFLGHPITITEAFVLESLGQAVRSSAFLIPGAYGIQEGGFMVLSTVIGLDQEVGLALSLVKRVRELLVGLPALLVWYFVERRQLRV